MFNRYFPHIVDCAFFILGAGRAPVALLNAICGSFPLMTDFALPQ
jgi:hypothetical protein